MQLRFFGGLAVGDGDGERVVTGRGQQALLFRLALDTSTTVSYRALIDDVWAMDAPEEPRAALQSLASRLRRSLPSGALEAAPGGYRLTLTRDDIDITRFADLVARARSTADDAEAAAFARDALALWVGEPWTPGDGFDWAVRDLLEDRAHAERLARRSEIAHDSAASRTVGADAASAPEAGAAAGVPAALTSLVGRTPELALIEEQLANERLVTLIGPGGAGKTTLALETARHRPGSIVAELAPAAPGEVWTAVAGAIGRSIRLVDAVTAPVAARERVLDALAGRSALLVLDNCEHVSDEVAEVALDVLRAVPGLRILATSREPLGMPGEAFVDLGPLPLPDAVELFRRRMRAACGHLPEAGEDDLVARLVQRLDGLPLALELAAAKTRTLSLAEIDRGLDDRFALLNAGPRAGAARHQTLRALIDWSWETLPEAERAALMAAALFPDGFDASDVGTIGRHLGVNPGAFDDLVDRSLLARRAGRFRMLETVREYGLDRLRATGGETRSRTRAAEAMAELAIDQDAALRGPEVRAGLAWFDANEENLTAALRHSVSTGARSTGQRLVRALLWPWFLRERFDELETGLTAFASIDDPLESEASVVVNGLALLVTVAQTVSEDRTATAAVIPPPSSTPDSAPSHDSARDGGPFTERIEKLVAAARRHPSELTAALIALLLGAGVAAANRAAGAPWPHGFTVDDPPIDDVPQWTRAFLSTVRAAFAQNSGDVETLGRESERAVAMFRDLGEPWGLGFASQFQSEWLMLEGRLEEALAVADESSATFSGLTSTADAVQQRSQAAGLLVRLGRVAEARERMREIAETAEADGSERAIGSARMGAAAIEIGVGDGAAALRELDSVSAGFLQGVPDQFAAWWGSKRAQALLLLVRPDEARAVLVECAPRALRSGDQPIMSDVALSVAGWLVATGRDDDARRALACATALRGRRDEGEPFRAWVLARLGTAEEDHASAAAPEFASLIALLGEPA